MSEVLAVELAVLIVTAEMPLMRVHTTEALEAPVAVATRETAAMERMSVLPGLATLRQAINTVVAVLAHGVPDL